jgi:hypothetical protein
MGPSPPLRGGDRIPAEQRLPSKASRRRWRTLQRQRLDGDEQGTAFGYTAVILQGAALTVADTLLIPVRPRTLDVWSVEQMAGLVREARVVNDGLRARRPQRRRSAGKDNDEAAAAMAAADGLAWALPTAAAAGRSVVEQAGQDPKAAPS